MGLLVPYDLEIWCRCLLKPRKPPTLHYYRDKSADCSKVIGAAYEPSRSNRCPVLTLRRSHQSTSGTRTATGPLQPGGSEGEVKPPDLHAPTGQPWGMGHPLALLAPPKPWSSRADELHLYFRNKPSCAALWCNSISGHPSPDTSAKCLLQTKAETWMKVTEVNSTNHHTKLWQQLWYKEYPE